MRGDVIFSPQSAGSQEMPLVFPGFFAFGISLGHKPLLANILISNRPYIRIDFRLELKIH